MGERRWPLQPLLTRLRCRTDSEAAARLGVSGFTLDRYAVEGLSDEVADRRVTFAGLHPAQVWGWEWVEAGLTPLDEAYLRTGWRQAWLWAEAQGEAA